MKPGEQLTLKDLGALGYDWLQPSGEPALNTGYLHTMRFHLSSLTDLTPHEIIVTDVVEKDGFVLLNQPIELPGFNAVDFSLDESMVVHFVNFDRQFVLYVDLSEPVVDVGRGKGARKLYHSELTAVDIEGMMSI